MRQEPSPSTPDGASTGAAGERRRQLHKVLADDTRNALMGILATSTLPLTANDLAARLGLHPNTVRPHLERLRAVGLVCREVVRHGDVGRPQHHYSAVPVPELSDNDPDADALSLLAEAMLTMVRSADMSPELARRSGAETGVALGQRPVAGTAVDGTGTIGQLASELDRLGFEPTVYAAPGGGPTEIVFGRCPFGTLADEAPEIVCSIHEGLLDGFAGSEGRAEIVDFVGPGSEDAPDSRCKVLINTHNTQ